MSPPRAKDAIGMPVPPAWVLRAATAMRDGLGRAHDRMAPGFVLVLERLFGALDNKALFCAVDLDVPDMLAAGPLGADEIAARTNADPDAVDRILRYLVARGIFDSARDGRYRNNAASDVLRKDHEYSWRGWVEFFGSAGCWEILNELPGRVRTGRDAAEAAHGMPFFEYLHTEAPAVGEAFNRAMVAGSRLQSLVMAETIDLDRFARVCDVGGGTGGTVSQLLAVNPGMRGTVFDLPDLREQADAFLEAAGIADRAGFVGGNFFESVPPAHDLYTMFAIVHDWGDDECVRILSNIRDAMPAGGRVMFVEQPLRSGSGGDFAKASDVIMLAHSVSGRERTQAEYASLVERAGLRLVRETILPTLFHVFELAV